jgi:hypothetical protein
MKAKIALNVCVPLFVFLAVGWYAAHVAFAHAAIRYNGSTPEARLGADAAGLFAGGAAAVLTLIVLLLFQARKRR